MSDEATTAEPPHRVTAYAEDVLAGRIVAGKRVRQACKRHLDDLEHGAERGLTFDTVKADHAIGFIEKFCHHWKGRFFGKPFLLEPWQAFIVGAIFGWIGPDGLRRFRTAYVQIAKKNGKSALAAAIGVYMLVADREPGAEIYSAATKRDQAKIVLSDAMQYVRMSRPLDRRIKIKTTGMTFPKTASTFTALSAESGTTSDGINPHCGILDEVHLQKTRGILDVLGFGMDAREQPLLFEITTAGDGTSEVCLEERAHSIKVLGGVIEDDRWFAYIAELDDGDDWADPEVWLKANPNLDVSVTLSAMRGRCAEAIAKPGTRTSFRRYRCNEWVGQGADWIAPEMWALGDRPIRPEELEGRRCFGGMDLSTKLDLTCFCFLWPPDQVVPYYIVVPFFFMPDDNLAERAKADRVPYVEWRESGELFTTDGAVVDYDEIEDTIISRSGLWPLQEIGYDPWNATATVNSLDKLGFEMVEVRQGHGTLAWPAKELEAQIAGGNIVHGGHPVLKWNASNVTTREDENGNRIPAKKRSKGRIDGISALLTAFSRAIGAGAEEESMDDIILQRGGMAA